MRILFTLITTLFFIISIRAQYIITTNPKCVAALEEKSQRGDPSLNTAINFIETAKKGSYNQWHSLLSKECNNETQGPKTKEWWHYLSKELFNYYIIAEQRINATENKIVYFKSQTNSGKEKILKVKVIRENNEWKVQSLEL